MCVTSGRFPDELKTTVIKPLFKKGDTDNMSCYRPIALVSVFSKIFEKVLYNGINEYFEKNAIFTEKQKGFRKNKTIDMAIYDLLEIVTSRVDKRLPTLALFMDMTKAFDHVDHKILLRKLYSYGIRGNIYNLIESYLQNRRQYTVINRICSKTKIDMKYESDIRILTCGVPQGSVLGPLLFLIYINDLPTATLYPMTMFADDSTIIFNSDNVNTLECDINNNIKSVINWLKCNNLQINLNKTLIMKFRQRTNDKLNLNINFNNVPIKETKSTKFLGIHIENTLSWGIQIENVCNKLNQYSYVLKKLRNTVNKSTLLTAYHGLVASCLRYGIMFWGNATGKETAFIAQKRCVRAICNLQKTDSCAPYFKDLKILTLPCMYIYESVLFVRRNLLKYSRVSSLRRADKLNLIPSKTALFQKSIFTMGPKLYNKLPKCIKAAETINLFKKMLFKLLIDKAYYSIEEFLNDKI